MNNSENEEIDQLFKEDQEERLANQNEFTQEMADADARRIVFARNFYEGVSTNKLHLDGERLYKLGILLQHGDLLEDYLKAKSVAELAAKNGYTKGLWLAAAAEDRYLIESGKKQRWGTQYSFVKNGREKDIVEDDAVSGITDEMRKERGISPRNEGLFFPFDN